MDELDDLDEQGSEGTPAPPAAGTDAAAAEVERLKKENYKLRDKVRRTELSAKFGSDVVELIPAALPAAEWEGYAEKLQALKGAAPAPADEPPAASTETDEQRVARESAERAMAAVVRTPSHGGTPPSTLSASEIGELMRTDQAAAIQAMKAKYGDKPIV